ncbi:hypothetical protein HK096_002806 [Nowakowskiella sp. JEL0078]|nr:hypothetical protein HK096_002806 [Nowakowskiella sp. JEL0078]
MSLSNRPSPADKEAEEAQQIRLDNSRSRSGNVLFDSKDTTSQDSPKHAASSASEAADLSLDDSDKEHEDISDSGSDFSTYTLRPLSILRKRTTHTANVSKASPSVNHQHLAAPTLPLKNHLTATRNYIVESDRESNVIDSEDDRRSEYSASTSRSSNNISTEKKDKRDKKRERPSRYSHTLLVHTSIRASPLSKESPEQNYRGFYNLAMLLLFVLNMRLIIENWLKYGLLLSLPGKGIKLTDLKWMFISLCIGPLCLSSAYLTERFASLFANEKLPKSVSIAVFFLHFTTISAVISIPTVISWYKITHPVVSVVPLFFATILFLKLISYVLVNADLRYESLLNESPKIWEDKASREAKLPSTLRFSVSRGTTRPDKDKEISEPKYPDNITIHSLVYFALCPTLSYQISYPMTERFRKAFFAKRAMEFLVAGLGMYFLAAQYAAPTLQNSVEALDKLQIGKLIERWWNAPDISTYWRLWNLPVYNWGKRHIYLPLIINHKVPSWVATLVVFTVSAILHELLIGIPVHNLSGWAFWGMMGQLPLIALTKLWDSVRAKRFGSNKELFDTVGNLIFWISFTIALSSYNLLKFIVGQPMCILLYYFNYYTENKEHSGPGSH